MVFFNTTRIKGFGKRETSWTFLTGVIRVMSDSCHMVLTARSLESYGAI